MFAGFRSSVHLNRIVREKSGQLQCPELIPEGFLTFEAKIRSSRPTLLSRSVNNFGVNTFMTKSKRMADKSKIYYEFVVVIICIILYYVCGSIDDLQYYSINDRLNRKDNIE